MIEFFFFNDTDLMMMLGIWYFRAKIIEAHPFEVHFRTSIHPQSELLILTTVNGCELVQNEKKLY